MKDAKEKGRRTLGTRKVSDFSVEKQTVAYESKICAQIMVLFLPVFPFSQGNPVVPARRHFPNEKKTEKSLLDSPIESFDLSRRAKAGSHGIRSAARARAFFPLFYITLKFTDTTRSLVQDEICSNL
mgnify:CR=1 FL=1